MTYCTIGNCPELGKPCPYEDHADDCACFRVNSKEFRRKQKQAEKYAIKKARIQDEKRPVSRMKLKEGGRARRSVMRVEDGEVWESIAEASVDCFGDVGFSSIISRACKNGQSGGGWHWRYLDE